MAIGKFGMAPGPSGSDRGSWWTTRLNKAVPLVGRLGGPIQMEKARVVVEEAWTRGWHLGRRLLQQAVAATASEARLLLPFSTSPCIYPGLRVHRHRSAPPTRRTMILRPGSVQPALLVPLTQLSGFPFVASPTALSIHREHRAFAVVSVVPEPEDCGRSCHIASQSTNGEVVAF